MPTGGSVVANVGSPVGSEFEENNDDVGDEVDEDDEEGDHDDHLAGVGVQFQVALGVKREIAVWRGQGQTRGTKEFNFPVQNILVATEIYLFILEEKK